MTKENERKNGVNSVLRKKELQEAFQTRVIQNLERDNVEITKMMDSVDAEIKRGY